MKRFNWKLAICLTPLLISLIIVGNAFRNYWAGKGGFKLGVDLVGGTILIYEVDPTKLPERWDDADAQRLATRLKSRIDPGDLFNITVRVASKTRFEIILPTGGTHQIEAQNRAWRELVDLVAKEYPILTYRVPVGKTVELLASVVSQIPDKELESKPETVAKINKLIETQYTEKAKGKTPAEQQKLWDALEETLAKDYKPTTYEVGRGREGELAKLLQEQYPTQHFDAPMDDMEGLTKKVHDFRPDTDIEQIKLFLRDSYKPGESATTEDKKKAWADLLVKVDDKFGKVDLKVVGQVLNPDAGSGRKGRRGQSMTTEQVQERKELIAQVGTLVFRMTADAVNDRDALTAAEEFFKKAKDDPKLREQLDTLAFQGKPPQVPDPREVFDTKTGRYTYSWAELGNTFRHEHGLANPRDKSGAPIPPKPMAPPGKENDDFKKRLEEWEKVHGAAWAEAIKNPSSFMWERVARARMDGQPMPYTGEAMRTDGVPMTYEEAARQGKISRWTDQTLLYSREVKNRRLAEKDAEKQIEYFILTRVDPEYNITGDNLASASSGLSGNVEFRMKPAGAALFREFTAKGQNHIMTIMLDDYIESAANIREPISSNGQITGDFTPEKIEALVKVLRSGALPATLKPEPVSESTMGPTLGADTIKWGFISVVGAFAAVLVFMLIYYRFAGLVACVALLANLLLTVAFMVSIDATFTLPGLAGLVLMLGMAVDANVLIYERLREERERGASLPQALRNGYEHALPTIIDTHLSSIFTAVVLYVVGNDQLKGFGISLTVGLIISLFTSLYMTRVMFDLWQYKGWLTKLSMMKLFSRPNFNFMAIRYQAFTATAIITILGAALFIWRLDRGGLNIDFVGGVAYSGELKKAVSIEELRELLKPTTEGFGSKSKLYDPSVEQIYISDPSYSEGRKSRLFTVRVAINPDLPEDQRKPEVYVKTVQKEIERILGKDGADLLKTFEVRLPTGHILEPGNKEVYLEFVEPGGPGGVDRPTYASRAQLSMLLTRALKDNGLANEASQFSLEGLGKDNDGRFKWMKVWFPEAIKDSDKPRLEAAIREVQDSFQTPQPERLENFDSQLAAETQLRALYAIVASWGAILLYLWFRFGNWTFGLAAVLCLIHDLFFTLGVIAVCHYLHEWFPLVAHLSIQGIRLDLSIHDFKIDLPSVAALLTLVGYSVNDTIVVFDRIREVRGKNPALTPQMINDAVNQTLSRTILSSLTTWLVVFVLFAWGGEGVHLFAFVMVVGVIIGTLSSIYVASPLLLIFGEGRTPFAQREQAPVQPAGQQA